MAHALGAKVIVLQSHPAGLRGVHVSAARRSAVIRHAWPNSAVSRRATSDSPGTSCQNLRQCKMTTPASGVEGPVVIFDDGWETTEWAVQQDDRKSSLGALTHGLASRVNPRPVELSIENVPLVGLDRLEQAVVTSSSASKKVFSKSTTSPTRPTLPQLPTCPHTAST